MSNPSMATLVDNFNQGTVNTYLWTAPTIPASGSLASVGPATIATSLNFNPACTDITVPIEVVVPALICNGNSSPYINGVTSILQYDMTGSGISFEVASFTLSGATEVSVALYLTDEHDHNMGWQWVHTTPVVSAFYPTGQTNISSLPQFVRVREDSGTTYWDYSADGVNWTNATSMSNPLDPTSVTATIATSGAASNETGITIANLTGLI